MIRTLILTFMYSYNQYYQFFGWDMVAFLVGITEYSMSNVTQSKKLNLTCVIQESLTHCLTS
jgi:hypothetical protein